MIFAKESGVSRTVRSRRALPGRRIWPYVLVAIMIAVATAGGLFWFLRGDHRLPRFSLESVKSLFPSRSGTGLPPSGEGISEKRTARVKTPASEKAGVQRKKTQTPARKAEPGGPLTVEGLRADNADMVRQLQEMVPTGLFVVINTAGNRVVLRNGDKVEAEMIASCGSGNVLEDPKGGRRWTFDTPRGVFTVKTKVADPVWIKPDWAFIEEGEPIPKNRADRAEPGMMGDFAIGIGDGYYIHGTLYSRLLGRNVSHGCVRLGDADIDRLYHTLNKGDRVYIF